MTTFTVDAEAIRIITWFIVTNDYYKRSAMRYFGSINDCAQEVCLSILEHPAPAHVNCTRSTVCCNHVRWVIRNARAVSRLQRSVADVDKHGWPAPRDCDNPILPVLLSERRTQIDKAIKTLSVRLRYILKDMMDGLTLVESGRTHNVGKGRISQLRLRALAKLQHPSRAALLLAYAEGVL